MSPTRNFSQIELTFQLLAIRLLTKLWIAASQQRRLLVHSRVESIASPVASGRVNVENAVSDVRQLTDIGAVIRVVEVVLHLHLLLVQMLLQIFELDKHLVVGHVGRLAAQVARRVGQPRWLLIAVRSIGALLVLLLGR